MIKILVPGTLKRINCGKCGAVLQYDEKEDVKEECIEKCFLQICHLDVDVSRNISYAHSARIK